MTRVAILGAGDLGVQLAHHMHAVDDLDAVGFFDDTRERGTQVAGLPVLGALADVRRRFAAGDFDALLTGIGYRHLALRQRLFDDFSVDIPFARLVHPAAHVDPSCIIGPGAVIYPRCVIDMQVRIDANALLNVGCVVAHHSHIGAGCFLSPAVKIAGFVRADPGVWFGIGTILIDNIRIASGVCTGAGSVVIDDLVEPGLYVGGPARLKRGAAA